jgi:hypothetical protein
MRRQADNLSLFDDHTFPQNLPRPLPGDQRLRAAAIPEHAAMEIAADKFYGLSLADRADAIIFDGTLDYFDVEEGGAS